MQIFASTDEILRDDSTRLAARAQAAGGACEVHLVKGVPHIWPIFWRVLPEGRTSLAQVRDFVARTIPRAARQAA